VWDAGGRLFPKATFVCSALSSHVPFPLSHSASILKPPFVMVQNHVILQFYVPRRRYKPLSSVLHSIAVEDVQLDVVGSDTQRLYHA